jgi:chemotaxis protein MotA
VLLIFAGLVVVFGSIVTGYLLERGSLLVLMQPAELIIIAGGAAGIILVSSPARNLRILGRAVFSVCVHREYTRDGYLSALKLLYVLFNLGRGNGKIDLESHVEAPQDSEVFQAHFSVLSDVEATNFICDSLRMAISAGLSEQEVERLMVLDMEVQRSGRQQPLRVLMNVADSLPGLGIVAAVLGVVVTMQALGGPAEQIGQKVAAALVGTFFGILLCYGVVSPLSSRLESLGKGRTEYLQVLRVAITSFFRGASPLVAAESARRSIPLDLRPSLEEMETQLRREHIPRTRNQQQAVAGQQAAAEQEAIAAEGAEEE